MLSFQQKINIGVDFVFDMLKLSPLGKRRLKNFLPFTPLEKNDLNDELNNVEAIFNSFPEMRADWDRLRQRLYPIKDIINTFIKCKNSVMSETELFEIKSFALSMKSIETIFQPLCEKVELNNIFIDDLTQVLDILDPSKTRSLAFSLDSIYSEKLATCRQTKNSIESQLRLNPNDEYLKTQRMRIVNDEYDEQQRILTDLSTKLSEYSDLLIDSAHTLGKLDLTIVKACLADDWNLARPIITNRIYFEDMYNPYIADMLEQRSHAFTPVTIELKQGTTIISGANMSGKSVILKTLALNVYLASIGFFVFADIAEIMLFDEIISISEDLEDSKRGLSSFGGEILKLNDCVETVSNSYVLLLMDEFARGTNPIEGTKIARATAQYFNSKEVVCVMTTHFDTVANVANTHYQIVGLANCDCLNLGIDDIADVMDYNIQKVSNSCPVSADAIKVCKLLNLEKDILDNIN
ncbi:MAG: hypothetical protein RR054_00775 [Clostridia bacterium]